MVQTSGIIRESTRPVFNHNFYFPVRVVFPKMMQRKYEKTVLTFELLSKGNINIQVWDDDVTSADFLGGLEVTLHDILAVKSKEERTLLGALKKAKDTGEEPDEFARVKKFQWYD